MTAQPPVPVETGAVPSSQVSSGSGFGANNGFSLSGKAKPAVSDSTGLALDSASGAPVARTAPVEVPRNVKWEDPKTVVKAAPGSIPKGQGTKHVFTYVLDGDTASTDNGLRCRIDTIDAPEVAKPQYNKRGQAYGEESKRTLEELILNKEANVRIVRPSDKYGRAICQIEVEGKGVDHAMVQAGAAMIYTVFAKDTLRYPELLKAQEDSKKNKRGIWKNGSAEDPAKYR